MRDETQELLERAIVAARAGNAAGARHLFKWALDTDATAVQRATAWLWLGELSATAVERQKYLEKVLAQAPAHELARALLAELEGSAASRAHSLVTTPLAELKQQLICAQCGGRLAFAAEQQQLVCVYCGYCDGLTNRIGTDAWVAEHYQSSHFQRRMQTTEMVPGLTMKVCAGCSATYWVAAETFSGACVYCETNYLSPHETPEAVTFPQGLIPMRVAQAQAELILREIGQRHRFVENLAYGALRGLYWPVWSFDIVGEFYFYDTDRALHGKTHHANDVLVPGSDRLEATLGAALCATYDVAVVQPYAARYLVHWAAELPQLSVFRATERACEQVATRVLAQPAAAQYPALSHKRVYSEAVKLLLVPVWLTTYRYQAHTYQIAINGQTGAYQLARPPLPWWHAWLHPLDRTSP